MQAWSRIIKREKALNHSLIWIIVIQYCNDDACMHTHERERARERERERDQVLLELKNAKHKSFHSKLLIVGNLCS